MVRRAVTSLGLPNSISHMDVYAPLNIETHVMFWLLFVEVSTRWFSHDLQNSVTPPPTGPFKLSSHKST